MADLISKVVRGADRTDKPISSSDHSKGTNLASKRQTTDGRAFQLSTQAKSNGVQTSIRAEKTRSWHLDQGATLDDASSGRSSVSGINFTVPSAGIMKTVAVQVHNNSESKEQDVERGSTTSSTAKLHDDYTHEPHGSRI
jgi:hypothetical protein